MVEAVGTHGYAQTSVAELCRLAGVSKRTFYEQFANREACLQASYEQIVGGVVKLVDASRAPGAADDAELVAVLQTVICALADQPKAARLALVEMRLAGPGSRAMLERTYLGIEQTVARRLAGPSVTAASAVVARGVICGFERVIRTAILSARPFEPAALASALGRWALACCAPVSPRLLQASRSSGDHDTWPARPKLRYLSRRGRILRAAAELVAIDGFRQLTMPGIATRVSISEEALLALYPTPAACYLAAVERISVEALVASLEASQHEDDPHVAARLGIEALLRQIAEDRVLRSVVFEQTPSAGPGALDTAERLLQLIVNTYRGRLAGTAGEQSPTELAATVGALWGVIQAELRRNEGRALPTLADGMTRLALAPAAQRDVALAQTSSTGAQDPGSKAESQENSSCLDTRPTTLDPAPRRPPGGRGSP
jgi:AcrR family transcriptional regulator